MARLIRGFQARQELLQKGLKLRDLVGIEARQQLPIALGNGGDGLVDEPRALIGELDDHASSVIRVWEATDETSPLESIDPAGDAG